MQKNFMTMVGLVLGATATLSHASESRITALGNDRDYLIDVRNIYAYPTEVRDNPNALLMEVGTLGTTEVNDAHDPELGGIWHIGKGFAAAANVNRKLDLVSDIVADPALAPNFYTDVKNSFDLIGAVAIGPTDLAAHLYYGSGLDDQYTTAGTKLETSVLRLTLGAAMRMGSDSTVEASFFIDDFTVERNAAGGTTKADSDGVFGFNVRGLMPMGSNVTFIPSLKFQTGNVETTTLGIVGSQNQDHLELKAGMNYQYESLLFVGGLAFEDYDMSGMKSAGLPLRVNIGLESLIYKEWLYGRIGAQKYLTGTEKVGAAERSLTVSDEDFFSIGLGIKTGNFSADAVIYENNLYSGTGLLSNNSSNLVGRISMEYQFH